MKVRSSLFTVAFLSAAVCTTAAEAKTHRLTDDQTEDQSTDAKPKFGWPGPALGWPTNGRPATERDLIGKKICWSDGRSNKFPADVQFTKWWVTEPGVVKIGERYRQLLLLPDGGFYEHWYSGHKSITGHHERWGKVCT